MAAADGGRSVHAVSECVNADADAGQVVVVPACAQLVLDVVVLWDR